MAEWKKVIVSGSAAELSSLTLDTGLANSELANDGITIAGQDISLGGSITADTILDGVTDPLISASVLSSPGQGQALLTTNGVAGSTIDLGLETTDNVTFNEITASVGIYSGKIRVNGGATDNVSISPHNDIDTGIYFPAVNSMFLKTATGDSEVQITDNKVVIDADKIELLGSVTASGDISSSGTITANALSLDTALSVANGGTGATTLTDGGVLLGSGTGAITATAVLTNGQLLIGDGSGDPTVGTLSEGNGITVTNGAGSITLAIDGTDAVTFSNNASIFSGSFSGSFEGDGSNLTGVSATSFDFDSLDDSGVSNSSVADADLFAFSDAGTEKKITYAQLYGNIFGELDGDISVAADGAVTIAADSVALGTDTTGNYVATVADAGTGAGIVIGGATGEGQAATVKVDLNDLSAAAVTVANDSIAIIDADDNTSKKESIADLAAAMASTGITATNGVFTANASEIDHDSLSNFSADEHFTQANITTVGTVTTGDVSAILPSGTVSASAFISPSQGTVRATINGVQTDVDLGLQTGDSPQFTNLTVSGDLTVQGTTTTLQTTNLSIEDQFITIASGSQSATDGGFVVSKQADGAGFAVGYDTATTRWVLDADLAVDATGIVADAYLSTIEVSVSAPSAAPIYGGASNGYGNMHVKTDTGDIYIYA